MPILVLVGGSYHTESSKSFFLSTLLLISGLILVIIFLYVHPITINEMEMITYSNQCTPITIHLHYDVLVTDFCWHDFSISHHFQFIPLLRFRAVTFDPSKTPEVKSHNVIWWGREHLYISLFHRLKGQIFQLFQGLIFLLSVSLVFYFLMMLKTPQMFEYHKCSNTEVEEIRNKRIINVCVMWNWKTESGEHICGLGNQSQLKSQSRICSKENDGWILNRQDFGAQWWAMIWQGFGHFERPNTSLDRMEEKKNNKSNGRKFLLTAWLYGSLEITSGAIQYGVPTSDLRFGTSGVIWAQNPKSDSLT